MRNFVRLLVLLAATAAACGGSSKPPTVPLSTLEPDGKPKESTTTTATPEAAQAGIISKDILAREPLANTAGVKHILIAWNDGDAAGLTERAAARSQADADALVGQLMQKLASGTDFDSLMKEHSDDPGSASLGKLFDVTPDAGLVIEFRQLSLRLKVGEIGVCQSDFGYHIIKRYK